MASQAPTSDQLYTAPSEPAHAGARGYRGLLVNLLIAAVGGGGCASAIASLVLSSHHLERLPLVMIVGAFILSVVRLRTFGDRITLSAIPMIAAGYMFGPIGGAIAGLAAGLGLEARPRRPTAKSFFNVGLFVLSSMAAAGAARPLAHAGVPEPLLLIACGAASGAAFYTVNVGLLCLAIGLDTGQHPLQIWRERWAWMAPQTLLLAQVGVGIVPAYQAAGLYEIGIFALPVVVLQLAWRQYLAHMNRSVEELREKNNELVQLAGSLQAANDTITATYRETLDALITALDARDNEVQGHSYRVSVFSQEIATELGIQRDSPEFEAIARGALLHDVGKIGVRDAVLLKPGQLDASEWIEMKRHAEIGFGILHDVEFLRSAAALVRAHHEKFDGTGYPLGLKGEEIPLGARIFAVADTFDAITTDRPYRKAAPPQAAVAEIQRCSGTQFDPAVVEVFERIWPRLWEMRESTVVIAA